MSDGRGDRRLPSPPAATGDAAIVNLLMAREAGALRLVHDRYADLVRALVAAIVGEDRSDRVVGETFVRLWRHPETALTEHTTLRSYLCTSAFNSAYAELAAGANWSFGREVSDVAKPGRASAAADADAAVTVVGRAQQPPSVVVRQALALAQLHDYPDEHILRHLRAERPAGALDR